MSYDYKTETFPPALDLAALNDIIVYTKAGDWRDDLKPLWHVQGFIFAHFAKSPPAPNPVKNLVGTESPFGTHTFAEGLVYAANPISPVEIQAHIESTSKPTFGIGLGDILLVYRVLKTLSVEAPAIYAFIKSFLTKSK